MALFPYKKKKQKQKNLQAESSAICQVRSFFNGQAWCAGEQTITLHLQQQEWCSSFPGSRLQGAHSHLKYLSTNIHRYQWILHKQTSKKKNMHLAALSFSSAQLANQSLHFSLPARPGFSFVTASTASTFYSCKWMITQTSHLRSVSDCKAETPRPYCPYTELCTAAVPQQIFLPKFPVCFFFMMICSEVPSRAGWGLAWPSSGFTRNNGKLLWTSSSLQISSGLGKRPFYSCQLTKHSFYPSLLGNLLIRPFLERIANSLWAAGNFA